MGSIDACIKLQVDELTWLLALAQPRHSDQPGPLQHRFQPLLYLTRYGNRIPLIRAVTSGCRVQKGNDNDKCMAERVARLLGPAGGVFAGQLWARRAAYESDKSTGF
eukprot:1779714-Pyramimonas_sp.AAC.1